MGGSHRHARPACPTWHLHRDLWFTLLWEPAVVQKSPPCTERGIGEERPQSARNHVTMKTPTEATDRCREPTLEESALRPVVAEPEELGTRGGHRLPRVAALRLRLGPGIIGLLAQNHLRGAVVDDHLQGFAFILRMKVPS